LEFPYLLLLISGGHTQYLLVESLGKYKRLGTTIDDALGEAFDKTAKIIGIDFPGGPKIEKFAEKGNKNRFKLPKPIINRGGCNLSFAGLKTAILRIQSEIKTEQDKFDLAASFQKTIEEILHEKTKKAFEIYLNENTSLKKTFVVAGGVAANQGIKNSLINLSNENEFECLFPDINLCSDNAAMIALVGLEKFKKKLFNELDFKVNPRWQLDDKAQFLKGAGVKI
jgi:N6-L-threonylcarbamoyladenine synthase